MPYATKANIDAIRGPDLLLRVADRDRDGVVDASVVDQALEQASAEVDTYLATRYTVPLGFTSAHVRAITIDIAVYRICADDASVTEDIVRRYEAAIGSLRDIAAGRATLVPPSPPPPPGGTPPTRPVGAGALSIERG